MASRRGINPSAWCVTVIVLVASLLITGGLCQAVPATVSCAVTEPYHNATFDMDSIKSTMSHHFSFLPLGDFQFNMCGAQVPGKCNGVDGVGACLSRDLGNNTTKEIILGYSSGGPVMVNSLNYFNYVGEMCNNATNTNYTLSILMECSYDNERNPINLIKGGQGCDYMLRFRSRGACLKSSERNRTQCRFKLEKGELNFAQLPNTNVITMERDKKFIVNVCNPVIYRHDASCPPDTHVCVYDNATKVYSSVGSKPGKLIYNSSTIALNYSSETVCSADPKRNMSSIIYFKCDTQNEHISFVSTVQCTNIFEWLSIVGCGIVDPPCVEYDPISHYKYDLSTLGNSTFNVSREGNTYSFGLCKAPSSCVDTAGACNEKGLSLGAVNSDLKFDETGYPFLKYENGPICKAKNQSMNWFTKIELICAKNETENNKAVLLEDTDCRLIIQFATDKACPPEQISCKDNDFDLTPLINSTGNYEAGVAEGVLKNPADKNVKFYMNVCRPIISSYGLSCQGGSAVCRAQMINGKPENETSLGFPDISLTAVNNSGEKHPQLKYLRGDPCPQNPKEDMTSTIDFRCNPKAGRGNPILKNIEDDCHYQFEWQTNVLCPGGLIEYDKQSCSLKSNETNGQFLLSTIEASGNVTLNEKTLNLCALSKAVAKIDYFGQLAYLRIDESDVSAELVLECRGDANKISKVQNNNEQYNWTVTIISPRVCELFDEKVEAGDQVTVSTAGTTTTTTTAPAGTATKSPSSGPDTSPITTAPKDNGSTTVAPSSNGGGAAGENKAAPPAPTPRSGMSAWGITGVLFLVCACVVLVGLAFRSPQRRAQVMSLFRRRSSAVSYTRDFDEPYYSI